MYSFLGGKNVCVCSPQAAGIRLGTLIESLTGLVAAVAVGFAYSWIMAIVILAFMPIIAASSSLHFTLSAGSTRRTSKALKESTEVHTATCIILVYTCTYTDQAMTNLLLARDKAGIFFFFF